MLGDGIPCPNCFGNAWFDMGIHVVSVYNESPCTSINSISILPKLVFENGDTASEIEMHTDPKQLKIIQDGMVRFKVKIDTLSMYHDNRQFKIVFSVFNAPKHINSCTTTPFRLVYVFLSFVFFVLLFFFFLLSFCRNFEKFRKKFHNPSQFLLNHLCVLFLLFVYLFVCLFVCLFVECGDMFVITANIDWK